ncbi:MULTISPECIES: MarR family winged helix-turn-helix transcriptional regulator [unclassified Arthrobacter]|uniref:MarR family winged helix-turn-helix transcriptional regulator n=1 Tax=unclassified Arthrobacter TaxID=235627 RepID=UPI00159E025B|nr:MULTISPECIES: MarR family transcriptional regulator [unclassified Arthrobacter]MCQ9162601.1 MarR family transcriptional regulator [Arthrobacter sp. STN4]NVM97416.1 MarR family transcriptional regulator [Arthrobacter sp. SDTb3-6]
MTDPFAVPPELPPVAQSDAVDPALQDAIRDVERQFGIMIIKTRKSIISRAAAIHPELQPMGFKVLTILSQSGPIQQIALAHKVDADKAAMSRSIKQLEELGLVARTPDPSDGRAHLVAMTDQAHTRFDATQAQARKVLYDRLAEWDTGEVRRFAELLDRLNENRD